VRRAAQEDGRDVAVLPTELVVQGDEAALRRALSNLVANAVVHGAGDIMLGADADAGGVVLWVQDEGRIDPQVQAVAFDRFSRGPETSHRPGVGLGLALVQAVARRHGGTARIANLAHGGVRAEIRVPRARALSDPRPA
jgi:signal transduction histidine kinase